MLIPSLSSEPETPRLVSRRRARNEGVRDSWSSMEDSDSAPGSPVRDTLVSPMPSLPSFTPWCDLPLSQFTVGFSGERRRATLPLPTPFLSVKDRNREAAARYRAKNKDKVAKLEREVQEVRSELSRMKMLEREIQELRAELSRTKRQRLGDF